MNDGTVATPAVTPRTARPARPGRLACPNCGSPVVIRASGISITAACPSCGAVLDVANDDVRLIAAAQQRTRNPPIAIGTRGTLDGTEWEVVGYQVRSSEAGWRWEEYLLFNPYQGFRFLARDHGLWTLYTMLRQAVSDDGVIANDRRRYRLETTGTAETEYVLGEFYWRVKAGDTVDFKEFVDAPYVLSQERNGTEVTWSRGVSIEPSVISDAFRLDALPPEDGGAADEPAAMAQSVGPLWGVAALALVLLIILASVSFGRDRNLAVFQQQYTVAETDQGHALPATIFTVPDSGGNLTLEISASGPRNWLDLDLALVSAGGDRRFEAPVSIGPYQDKRDAEVTFASVPGGSYKLLVTVNSLTFFKSAALATPAPAADKGTPEVPWYERFRQPNQASVAPPHPPVTFVIGVRRHTPVMGYFWIVFVAILAWPASVSLWRWYLRVQNGQD